MPTEEEFDFPETTPELQALLDHRDQRGGSIYGEWREKWDALQAKVQKGLYELYCRKRKEWMCRDSTQTGEPRIIKAGRYELHISRHSTGKNTWNYSKGRIYRDGQLIETVYRNYGAFPHLFIEQHQNGHDYLLCGEDYQGQTVIELDTGRRRDSMSNGSEKGHGFCWADYRYDKVSSIITVDGCYWACPYEYKFFDFSDPMERGWPEIECEGGYIDTDVSEKEGGKWPEISGDTIKCYHHSDDDDEEYDPAIEDDPEVQVIRDGNGGEPYIVRLTSIQTFKREGSKLVLQDEWVSDKEQQRRQEQEEANQRYEAWMADFKANDPLYLAYAELVKDDALSPQDYYSRGITHKDWCPGFTEHETRWCRRVVTKKPWSIDLEWAVKTGPVKLVVYKDGKHVEDKFWMEHSVESMRQAFAYAKSLVVAS